MWDWRIARGELSIQQVPDSGGAVGYSIRCESDDVDCWERREQIIIPQDGARNYMIRGTLLTAARVGYTRAIAAIGLKVHVSAGSLACGAELRDAAGGVLDVATDQACGLDGVGDGVCWVWQLWSIGGGA